MEDETGEFERAVREFVTTLSDSHSDLTPPSDEPSTDDILSWVLRNDENTAFLRQATRLIAILAEGYPDRLADTIDQLVPLLDHEDRTVRRQVGNALGYVAAHRPQPLIEDRSLIVAKLRTDPAIQRQMAWIVASFAEPYPDRLEETVPQLATLLDDNDRITANHAARAIAHIAAYDPAATEQVRQPLLALLHHPETYREAARALAAMVPEYSDGVLENIIEQLETGPPTQREHAAWAIAEIAKRHPSLFTDEVDQIIDRIVTEDYHQVVDHLSGAIRNIVGEYPEIGLHAGRTLLDSDDGYVSQHGCLIIGEVALNHRDRRAITTLEKVAETADSKMVRSPARDILAELEANTEQ